MADRRWAPRRDIQAHSQMVGEASEAFTDNVATFLRTCSEDVKHAPEKCVQPPTPAGSIGPARRATSRSTLMGNAAAPPRTVASICHKFKEQAIALGQPKRAILPLLNAIKMIQPSPEFLTPQHADLAQA